MRILAIDPGTRVGWAYSDGIAASCISGVEVFTLDDPREPGQRFAEFHQWLDDKMDGLKPDLFVYEKAFIMPRGATTAIFFGLIAVMQSVCYARSIAHAEVNAIRLKKWTTGHGRATKAMMLDVVSHRWKTLTHGPLDCTRICIDPAHDEADAIAVLHYTLATHEDTSANPQA